MLSNTDIKRLLDDSWKEITRLKFENDMLKEKIIVYDTFTKILNGHITFRRYHEEVNCGPSFYHTLEEAKNVFDDTEMYKIDGSPTGISKVKE